MLKNGAGKRLARDVSDCIGLDPWTHFQPAPPPMLSSHDAPEKPRVGSLS